MSKTKLDNILKGGNKLKIRDIDIDDPEFDEIIKAAEDEKNYSRKRQKKMPKRDLYSD